MHGDSRHSNAPPALVVDLDGTLIRCNSFHRELLTLVKTGHLRSLLLELMRSKAWTKARIKVAVSKYRCDLDYRPCFSQRVRGLIVEALSRNLPVLLATGASALTAQQILAQLDLDIPFISSTPETNLTGKRKAKALIALFGARNFTYVGDSRADLEVLEYSYGGILICDDPKLSVVARKRFPAVTILPREGSCGH